MNDQFQQFVDAVAFWVCQNESNFADAVEAVVAGNDEFQQVWNDRQDEVRQRVFRQVSDFIMGR